MITVASSPVIPESDENWAESFPRKYQIYGCVEARKTSDPEDTEPIKKMQRAVLSLFTGAGGLDLGLEVAGFSIANCVEIDEDARQTLQLNRPRWKLAEPGNIHKITPEQLLNQAALKRGDVVLLAGGSPCQPFSKSAYWAHRGHKGLSDPRANTLRAYLRVVEAALPQVLLLENVNGITLNGLGSRSGSNFLADEIRRINRRQGTNYRLQLMHLNSADYGVPQFRNRLFIIASIEGRELHLPPRTHGDEAGLEPYLTAWDAIGDLDERTYSSDLKPTGKWADLLVSIPEGKNYLWHTPRGKGQPLFGWRTKYWSFLLKLSKRQPSWTIQSYPGPATGPFHWRNRLLSLEELLRIQTFPKNYKIVGDRRSAVCQIGNAVPSAIGELLGMEIRRQLLDESRVRRRLRLIPRRCEDFPRSFPCRPVARRYLHLRALHPDHPGKGLGPGARTKS
jgi:DNA (cytosine-5)-methyltransferase 1